MNKSILLSFEMDGKFYEVAGNRDVVKRAAEKEPNVFNGLLKRKKDKGDLTFAEIIDENDKVQTILKALFACGLVSGTPNVNYGEAEDIYETLWFNLDDESRAQLSDKMMSLLNNTDFIKGSNQRKATIKMMF